MLCLSGPRLSTPYTRVSRSYPSFTSNLPAPQGNSDSALLRLRHQHGGNASMSFRKPAVCFLAAAAIAAGAFPQVTPAAGVTPPDDTAKVNVGATIFGDYTYPDSPTSKDVDGNVIHPSAFNITRAYLNITGNLNHLIAFRI